MASVIIVEGKSSGEKKTPFASGKKSSSITALSHLSFTVVSVFLFCKDSQIDILCHLLFESVRGSPNCPKGPKNGYQICHVLGQKGNVLVQGRSGCWSRVLPGYPRPLLSHFLLLSQKFSNVCRSFVPNYSCTAGKQNTIFPTGVVPAQTSVVTARRKKYHEESKLPPIVRC